MGSVIASGAKQSPRIVFDFYFNYFELKNKKNTKQLIFDELNKIIDSRIEAARLEIRSIDESKKNETKSSAGDKYETGRAMMQIEEERNNIQLSKAVDLKNILSSINLSKQFSKVELGSLIITDQGNYFLSIGLGKIMIDEEVYYSISTDSPLGKALFNKCVGDTVVFLEKKLKVLEVF